MLLLEGKKPDNPQSMLKSYCPVLTTMTVTVCIPSEDKLWCLVLAAVLASALWYVREWPS